MMVLACVFIVTCPCALAINGPLVQGLMVRYLSSFGVYIKDGRAIELAADTSHVVFDKTGTLTEAQKKISVLYENMTEDQTSAVVATMNGSMHPVCTALLEKFKKSNVPDAVDFKEHIGNGISAKVNGVEVRVGRYTWLQEFMVAKPEGELDLKDSTAILLDGKLVAAYGFHEKLRFTVGGLIKDLAKHFQLSLISGDHNESIKEKSEIKDHIKETRFKLNPQEKADYIRNLKKDGNKVLMVGDGLNDAGALSSSHIGVAVLEEKMNFCPASDVIIEGDKLKSLGLFLNASKFGKRLIKVNMAISLIYNLFGISIAISGVLTPLFVAILMPLSRLSLLVSSVLGVQWFSRRGLEWK